MPKDPVLDFMMPESTAAVKDFRELAKELRPIEDPNLTPEEAKKQ